VVWHKIPIRDHNKDHNFDVTVYIKLVIKDDLHSLGISISRSSKDFILHRKVGKGVDLRFRFKYNNARNMFLKHLAKVMVNES